MQINGLNRKNIPLRIKLRYFQVCSDLVITLIRDDDGDDREKGCKDLVKRVNILISRDLP